MLKRNLALLSMVLFNRYPSAHPQSSSSGYSSYSSYSSSSSSYSGSSSSSSSSSSSGGSSSGSSNSTSGNSTNNDSNDGTTGYEPWVLSDPEYNLTSSYILWTINPTMSPTRKPTTRKPVTAPPTSSSPTVSPTASPTKSPTSAPTIAKTPSPTSTPTAAPTVTITDSPTPRPTSAPTVSCALSLDEREAAILGILSNVSSYELLLNTFTKDSGQDQYQTDKQNSTSNSSLDFAWTTASTLEARSFQTSGNYVSGSVPPQNLALEWIVFHDEQSLCPPHDSTHKIVQRYVMALLYYSMGGSEWVQCRSYNDTLGVTQDPTVIEQDVCGLNSTSYRRFLSAYDECTWYGIQCTSGGHVMSIRLDDNNLSGELPSEITQLFHLKVLKVDGNQIRGSIPNSIGSLTKLQVLDLQSNQFGGSLPDALWSLSTLASVDLGTNQFTGTISPLAKSLVDLTQLELENNYFTGYIPKAVCDLRSGKLQLLSADCNPIVSFDQAIVQDPEIDCPCCTQCYTQSASVSDVAMDQFAVIACSNGHGQTGDDAYKASSVYVLHFSYKVQSSANLDQVNPVLDNAIVEYVAKDVLSCTVSRRNLHQRRSLGIDNAAAISAYPPDTVKQSCVADNGQDNCVEINGLLTLKSAPGEYFDLSEAYSVIRSVLFDATISIKLSNGGQATAKVTYLGPYPFTGRGSTASNSETEPKSSVTKDIVAPIALGAVFSGLVVAIAFAVSRRLSKPQMKENPYSDSDNFFDDVDGGPLGDNNLWTVPTDIRFVDATSEHTVSDIVFPLSKPNNNITTAWANPNEDGVGGDATIADEPSREETRQTPTSETLSEEDKYPFHVVHQYPAWFRTDTTVDLNSISESQAGDDWKTASDFNSAYGGSGSMHTNDSPVHPVV